MSLIKDFRKAQTSFTIAPSKDGTPNAFTIKTKYGYIDYVHDDGVNSIWWVESNRHGQGSVLVDLMQQNHPASAIAWGVTSIGGRSLADKWHRNHPEVDRIDGAHEGQFDPFGEEE